MPANRVHPRTFTKCGHKGLGAYCHRCAEGDRLIAIGKGEAKPAAPGKNRRVESFKGWSKDAFLKEGARLKAPRVRENTFTPTTEGG
jgi:hypothetical protein